MTAPFLQLPLLVDCCVCTPAIITVVVSVFNVVVANAAIVAVVAAAGAVAMATATFAVVGVIVVAPCHWSGCCPGCCRYEGDDCGRFCRCPTFTVVVVVVVVGQLLLLPLSW